MCFLRKIVIIRKISKESPIKSLKDFYLMNLNSVLNVEFYLMINLKSMVLLPLILKMFPNAQIIIDKFHLTQLVSRAFNKTRIMIMKKHKQHYRKLKRYWKLLLKYRENLDNSVWKRFTCFEHLMTTIDVVNYLINIDEELKQTYLIYQDILHSLKTRNYKLLKSVLINSNNNISSYMKTAVKTLSEFLPYIKNTFTTNYHNGYIEGNNNLIKVIKRIAFGFRSFRRFKARK